MIAGIAILAGLFAAIFFHEAAHFDTAKAFNMKVTEFFAGFGPRLWSFRKGETEYGVKAFIPLGGYVKITGMNPVEEIDPADEHRTYRGKPFWQKSIVVLAGVAANLALAWVLVYLVFTVVGTPSVVDRNPFIVTDPSATSVGPSALDMNGSKITNTSGAHWFEYDASIQHAERTTLEICTSSNRPS